MTESTTAIIASLSAVFISVVTAFTVLYNIVVWKATITVKVETMWAFQMRRAVSEAVQGGLATLNSPLTFTSKSLDALAPIRDRLIAFGKEHNGEGQLAMTFELEACFGDELLKEFCLPLKTSHGACLLAALQIAKGSPVDITFDPYTEMPSLPLMALPSRNRRI